MKYSSIIFFLLFTLSLQAQKANLKAYRWQHRLLLLISKDNDAVQYNNQLQQLKEHANEFAERKLLILDIRKNKYRIITPTKTTFEVSNWITDTSLFEKYALKKEKFSLVLLGLDGGKKLKQTKIITKYKLFAKIDAMPMRRQVLKANE